MYVSVYTNIKPVQCERVNMKKVFLILPMIAIAFTAQASGNQHTHTSKYVGQEQRAIKSLSPEDISELRRGGGWGLAKAAELNGVPGPAHLLELKDEIPIAAAQIEIIDEIFNRMKSQAIAQGEKLIGLEQQLEGYFKDRTATDAILHTSLGRIAEARSNLRYIHLATHLEMLEILSETQIAKYNTLRGYAHSSPCENVPKGHDAKKWKKHNGCI